MVAESVKNIFDNKSAQIKRLNDRCNALSDMIYYRDKCFHNLEAGINGGIQEQLWGGIHGYRYIMHHLPENYLETRIDLWQAILQETVDAISFFELGTNIGANLESILSIIPNSKLFGIEINPLAVRICKERGLNVTQAAINEYQSDNKYDFVFTRGVLIHIKPSELEKVFELMNKISKKYILIWENYSTKDFHYEKYSKRVSKQYKIRTSEGFQYWGDFAGRFSDLYPKYDIIKTSISNISIKEGDLVWTLFKKND